MDLNSLYIHQEFSSVPNLQKMENISPVINANELIHLYQHENAVLVDAGNYPREIYQNRHLDRALFVDVNTELADIKADLANGGRHPLPEITDFAKKLTSLGINPVSHVIVYDDKNGANAAARFWWMLKAIGHQKVQVLNGGFQAAEKAGFLIHSKPETAKKVDLYPVTGWNLPLATIEEVEKVAQNPDHMVIDVRDPERYRGEKEPIDLVAGHIPGAVNIPLSSNLDENGNFLSKEALHEKYQKAFQNFSPQNIIVHCGSGVSACHTLLAIEQAGLPIPKLYVGSWSEWSRNEKEIGTIK